MAMLDPNVLNPYVLLDPSVALVVASAVTSASVILALLISRSFFRSYSFAGFGYLLGVPVGFAFLGASFGFELASVLFQSDPILHPAFFWIQMLLQSEAYALIALSYYYKNSTAEQGSSSVRNLGLTVLALVMIAIPFLLPTTVLVLQPYFKYVAFADLSFFMRLFNIAVIGYIFKSSIASLVKAANLKLLYVPAAFALLWLEQYSLLVGYFDNSVPAVIGSALARVAGLAVFAYIMQNATSRKRIEIEARKAA